MTDRKQPTFVPYDPKQKTLFILGAGFSMSAGGPAQQQILPAIFDLPASAGPNVLEARSRFEEFAFKTLGISKERLRQISLEDIYTPIDRCLADSISLRGHDTSSLLSIRNDIDFLIARAIQYRLDGSDWHKKSEYVRKFASTLVNIAKHRKALAQCTIDADNATHYDPLAVISLNWDILLDNALHRELEQRDQMDGVDLRHKYAPLGVVDYCCYVSSLEKNNNRIRGGLWALGAKGYNVKLLKLHGSLNWLQCETCQRLYVSYGEKSAIPNYLKQKDCRHCEKQNIESSLRSTLIMPTFLKDLSNFQLKLIWQNAGIEIMEARRIVFIGYSLPYADFEFRQLLARFVHRDAKIDLVLFSNAPTADRDYLDTVKRFKEFFGPKRICEFSCGAADYVQQCFWDSK
jgi:NAD-dependent SIR2 family protein deacetylase